MRYARSTLIILGAMTACFTDGEVSLSQEPKKEDPPAAMKKGDEVIALRVAPLQVEAKTVATVRKGDNLVVEGIQGEWLWVHSGQTHGWIESTSVIGAAIKAWYEREVDLTSWSAPDDPPPVDDFGRARSKVFGVTFDVRSLSPKRRLRISGQVGANNYLNGVRVASHFEVDYGAVQIALVEGADRRRTLSVNGKPYGTLEQGDHVLLNESREVFVNGFRRQPRG